MVAGQVVEFVVVAFEEIEVDQAYRERLAGGIGSLFRFFHRGEQGAPVVDARQIVAARLFLDIVELDAGLGEVALQASHASADEHEPRKRRGDDEELQHVELQHFDVVVARIAKARHQREGGEREEPSAASFMSL